MKKTKKLLVILLTLTLISCNILNASAMDYRYKNHTEDIYAENYSESITLEGIIYTFQYSYDDIGNRMIHVINEETATVDVVKYDNQLKCLLLNEEICSQEMTLNDSIQMNPLVKNSDWIYFSSGSNRITFAQGVSVAVLAALIATAVGNIGGTAVILAMGYNTLAVVAASSIGGVVNTTVYKFNSSAVTQWRYDWSFTASSGDYYGVYTSVTQL